MLLLITYLRSYPSTVNGGCNYRVKRHKRQHERKASKEKLFNITTKSLLRVKPRAF